jgi:hypothetical protein
MTENDNALSIRLARTLWINTYRGFVSDGAGTPIATLRLIPTLPQDPGELPPDAPQGEAYLTVLVEEASIEPDSLIEFESRVAELLLAKMTEHGFAAEYCLFAYPSPPHLL